MSNFMEHLDAVGSEDSAPNGWAHQTLFSYGWDWVGGNDDGRQTFETQSSAQEDLEFFIQEAEEQGMDYDIEDWRVMPYDPSTDDLSDL